VLPDLPVDVHHVQSQAPLPCVLPHLLLKVLLFVRQHSASVSQTTKHIAASSFSFFFFFFVFI
jgi:hypothetical protein